MSLQEKISILTTKVANNLATEILNAIQTSSLNDLVEDGLSIRATDTPVPYVPTAKASAKSTRKAPATRRNRLTGQDIIVAAKAIIAYVAKNPNVGAAQIQRALKIAKNQWLKVVTAAQSNGLKKKGEKRSTVYYTGSVKTAAKKTRKYTKKGATHLTAASNIAIETPATPDVWPGDAAVTNGAAVEATA
jgi:putative ribosome biogenesis GTPase RsgA